MKTAEMMRKKYSALLMQELVMMEDYGFYLPYRAFIEATGNAPENDDFLQDLINDSVSFTYKGKDGRRWKEFFWEGELEPNSYLEAVVEG
jgi:hypothetical protein